VPSAVALTWSRQERGNGGYRLMGVYARKTVTSPILPRYLDRFEVTPEVTRGNRVTGPDVDTPISLN
jgi:hypothetical protein